MTRKKKGLKSKESIILTGLELFAKQGYAQTSTQQIADVCGISQATVFYHFKNKKVLFEAIVDHVLKTNREIFMGMDQGNADPFVQLVNLLKANIKWCNDYPEQTKMILLLFTFAASDHGLKELATSTIDNGRSLVKDLLTQMENKNILKQNLNKESLSIVIQQYVNGVLFQILVREDREKEIEQFNNSIEGYLTTLLLN